MPSHKSKLALMFFMVAPLILVTAITTRADVVYISPFVVQPSGQGVVPTVLTLQHSGNNTSEMGAVIRGNGADVLLFPNPTGDVVSGINSKTILFSSLNTSAANLGIFLDIVEPGNDGSLTLTSLVLTAYNNNGTVLGTFNCPGCTALNLTETPGPGGGRSDHVFGLDATQALQLQGLYFANSDLRLGLSASFNGVAGGPEQFFFGARDVPQAPIPEPTTMILLGTGLVGIAMKLRKRHQVKDQ